MPSPGKKESAVAIVLGARQQVPADRSGTTAPVKVLAAAFGWDGRSADSVDQTVGMTWRPDASGSSRYEVVSRLALKPGRYEVRVALDAAPNQRGSVYTFVDVPDFAKQPLSLSGLVLAVSPAVPSAGRDAVRQSPARCPNRATGAWREPIARPHSSRSIRTPTSPRSRRA